jgi:phosphate transport system permease protein
VGLDPDGEIPVKKRIEEAIAKCLMIGATGFVIGIVLLILGTILARGLPSLSWEMISQPPSGGYYLGKGGGILNAIIGSLMIAGGATILSLFMALPVSLCLNVYFKKKSRYASTVRASLDVLWGIPSIVYGAFGFTLMLWLGLRASLLGGIIAVALMILPIMIRAMDEVIQMVPHDLLDASDALGATRWEGAWKVILRQALPGLASAVLIAFGRGIGDAASVLFTAGFSDRIPTSLAEPAATLPLAIFFQLGTPFPEVQQRGYAAALILTAIVLAASALARLIARRAGRFVIR